MPMRTPRGADTRTRSLAASLPPSRSFLLLTRQPWPLTVGIGASTLFEGQDADWPVLDVMCYHLMYSDWLVLVRFYCIFIVIKSCSNSLSAPSSAHCPEGPPLLPSLEAGWLRGSWWLWAPPLQHEHAVCERSVTRDFQEDDRA